MQKTPRRRETPISSFVINPKLQKGIRAMTRRLSRGSSCAVSTSMLIRAMMRLAVDAEPHINADTICDEMDLVAALKAAIKKSSSAKSA